MPLKVVRPHAHLCPDCNDLFWCACPSRWKVGMGPCGCRVEIPEAIDPKEIPY